MADQRAERRLAAILAGDVAGYSRLMGVDEEGTLRDLKEHRTAFLHPRSVFGVLIQFWQVPLDDWARMPAAERAV